MKIGLVTPYDWSYPGGVRDHVWHLAQEFLAMGHEIRILAPASGMQGKKHERYVLKMGGTTPIPINGSIARIILDPYLARRVRKVLHREHFDVVHIHEPLVPGLSQQVLRICDTLMVGTFHSASYSNMYSTSQLAYASTYPLLRPLFNKLAGRIAVSTAALDFISRYFPADYHIIPNGVSLERFGHDVSPLPHLMDGKKNILFVGRFEKRKGAKYLLRAIPAIRERHPDTRFILVGEGRLREGFQKYVVKQGWQDVIFTGYVSDEEKPHYFASAHVFCAPAIGGESLGIVLLEAMAAGVPIVASDIKGYATVVSQRVDGILTPPRQSADLAAAISHLLENEPLRKGFIQAGLVKARDYAWPYVARCVMDYYCELLDAQDRAARSYPRAL